MEYSLKYNPFLISAYRVVSRDCMNLCLYLVTMDWFTLRSMKNRNTLIRQIQKEEVETSPGQNL